ncbi:hypothetical protein F3Y22_tig00111754pilonHSYRG00093 [Hibiscus syriacus]|uniref:Disease resistance protein At4g27190-like leucine-rich repeats domain-containing protein n=1 Tax=Hibiscus syriacus TaxID=106335 RepID=A0A6A2XG70_HIBSY|nr:hypothetical protein F3Y22_tig00111754pilonHSYRG00093 [Hibiscus syriacus]
MHDLVRDMALHITRGTPRFLVKAGMSLTEPLDVQEWKQDLEQVSFMKNRELQVMYPLKKPPPRCPMITTLLVSDCGIKSIPGAFFKHMHGLKILDLSENPIKSLPGSISDLKNLTALLLAYCQNLKKVPSLSKLGVLKMLNGIPNGILSKLSCLQHLNVGETSVRGEEIAGFKKLEFFEGRFNDVSNLNMYVHALHDREGPREYLIVKCNLVCSEDDLLFSRFFRIPLATFSTLRILNINNCENMKRLFSPNCVPLNLQQLSVTNCNQMEEIIASEPESEGGGLVSLEHRLPQLTQLLLMDLPELKSICSVNEVMICDSLEKFWVLNCPKLKRMPLNPPELDNVRSSAAPALRIYIKPKEWWESVEWHHPDSKSLLEPFLRFCAGGFREIQNFAARCADNFPFSIVVSGDKNSSVAVPATHRYPTPVPAANRSSSVPTPILSTYVFDVDTGLAKERSAGFNIDEVSPCDVQVPIDFIPSCCSTPSSVDDFIEGRSLGSA